MTVNQLKEINVLLRSFSQRPIAYQKIYATITSSVSAGLLLSQVIYWWYACGERDFYKTDDDFRQELGLGPREMRTAKATLRKLGLVDTYRKGVPSKTHYHVRIPLLLRKISSLYETSRQDCTERPNKVVRNVQTITETKPESTPEITKTTENFSSEEILALDLKLAKEKKFFLQQLQHIFKPNKRSAVTLASVTRFLIDECQAGRLEVSIFKDLLEDARKTVSSRMVKKPIALFIEIVKKKSGFKRQEMLLSK